MCGDFVHEKPKKRVKIEGRGLTRGWGKKRRSDKKTGAMANETGLPWKNSLRQPARGELIKKNTKKGSTAGETKDLSGRD